MIDDVASVRATLRLLPEFGADADDVAAVEAARLLAAGRRAEFVVTVREGVLVDIAARDGGPR